MKLYKTTITPKSTFSTALKGDTLFGQMCWMVRYLYGENRLTSLLSTYEETPYLIVSDAFAQGHLPKPKMPGSYLHESSEEKKENRKKVWLTPTDLAVGAYQNAKTDEEAQNKDKILSQMHNSINYRTFHTGEGFDPYGVESYAISAKDIYFLIDDSQFSKEELEESFRLLSEMGYGKDTTIGQGRFEFGKIEEIPINQPSKSFMVLSPFMAREIECEKIFYEPFTRFGKFGMDRAHKNAFKRPLLLADTGGVIHYARQQNLQYIGNAIKNVSKAFDNTVHQGYAITIPIKDIA
jgi:CRISPR-associated protein Csm4